MPGSRISVELVGESAPLQAAVDKAKVAMTQLADTVTKTSEGAVKSGVVVEKSNTSLAASYQETSRRIIASVEEQLAAVRKASEAVAAADDKQVVGARKVLEAQTKAAAATVRAAEEINAAANKAATAEAKQAAAATRSADEQVAAARRSGDAQVSSARRTEAAFGSSSSALTKAGKNITLGLLGAAAASVDLAVKFQSNTLRMQTQAGIAAGQLGKLRQGILGMAQAVGYTPNQLADGMYHVVSSMDKVLPAASRVTDELHIMRIAAEGAQVGHSNLEETTYALVSAMNALHQKGADAGKTMGELNAIVGSGDMTMQDLLNALESGLIPTANTFGVSLQSLGAALAVMGDQGMRGALAGTRLRMSLALLGSPSKKAAKELETIGLSSTQAIASTEKMSKALEKAGLSTTKISQDLKQPNGLQYALQDLDQHLRHAGLTATGAAALISSAFGGGRSGAAIALMAQSTGRLGTKFEQIGRTAHSFGADWTATTHSAAFELRSFEGGVTSLATNIGTHLLPVLSSGVQDLSNIIHWFEHGSSAAHALEIAIGTLATVAIGSYLTSKLIAATKLMREFGTAIVNPIGAMQRFGAASRPGAAAGGLGGLTGQGGMLMMGARPGSGPPGSVANPLIVSILAGEYAGLSSQGAAGTVATEEKAAVAETGAVDAALAGGVAKETSATTGVLASLKTGIGGALSGALKGAGIAGIGLMGSQLAGAAIGGNAGKAVSSVGTAASIGAGLGSMLGPEGTIAGGITGALVGGFATFMNHDANKYGDDIAASVAKGLPVAISSSYGAAVAKAANYAHNLQGLAKPPGGIAYGAANASSNLHATRGGSAPGAPDLGAQTIKAWQDTGTKAGNEFVASFNKVKFPSTPAIFNNFMVAMKNPKLTADAKDAAAKVAIEFARGLESKGQLPKQATANLIFGLESQFPGLQAYLKQQGESTSADVANAMKMTAAQNQLQQTVTSMQGQFGTLPGDLHVTGQNMGTVLTQAMAVLKADMTGGTSQMRQAATAEYDKLKTAAAQDLAAMATNVAIKQGAMTDSIATGTHNAAAAALANFSAFSSTVHQVMGDAAATTGKGSQLIAKALIATLTAFGSSSIPTALLGDLGSVISQSSTVKNLAGLNPITFGAAAQGALVQFGQPGARGRDTIPVNMGGVPIMVGSGEVGAVFTRQQQQVANAALAPVGGLPGLFRNVDAKHYMDSGGFVPGGRYGTGGLGSPGSSTGGTVILDPGVNMSVGQEPQILTDLRALAAELHNAVYVISGYRSPQHSVQVGGFANDPHTRGEAADIGVGSSSRASMFGVTDAELKAVGLYRPFYPPDPNEVNHVQLLAGGASGPVIAVSGAGGATAAPAWKNIKVPTVGGTGTMADIVRAALGMEVKAANAYGRKHMPAGGGTFSGSLSGSVEHQIAQFFSAAGMNKIGIAGLIGNAAQESNLNWSTPGGGMWQQITNFGSGAPPSPLVQMTTMLGQIRGLIPLMNNAGSPGNAASIFMNQFEHPNVALENLPHRIAAANAAYAAGYASGGLVKWYDDVDPTHMPRSAAAVAAYNDGSYATGYGQLAGLFPHSRRLSISHALGSMTVADVADMEGNGTHVVADTVPWVKRMLGLGRTPVVYGGRNYPASYNLVGPGGLVEQLAGHGVKRSQYKLWLADYNRGPSIPGGFDALQYMGSPGNSPGPYDVSVAYPDFFSGVGAGPLGGIASGTQPNKTRIPKRPPKGYRNRPRPTSQRAQKPSTHTGTGGTSAPSIHTGVPVIDGALAQLGSLIGTDGQGGQVGKLSELLGFWPQMWSLTNPNLGQTAGGYIVSTDAAGNPVNPYIDTAAVNLSRGEVGKELGWENTIVKDLRKALSLSTTLLPRIRSEIHKRSQQVAAEKKKHKPNQSAITGWQKQIGVLNTALGQATSAGSLAGVSGYGGLLGSALISQATFRKELGELSTGSLATALTGAQAQGGTAAQSTLTGLLQQQNLQLSEEVALDQAQTRALLSMIPQIPQYAKGGPILRDGLINAHEGEHVVPRGGTLVMRESAGRPPEIHVHIEGDAQGIVRVIRAEIRDPANVKAVSTAIGNRTAMLGGSRRRF